MAIIKTGALITQISNADHVQHSLHSNDFAICKNPDKLKSLINKVLPGTTTFYISDGAWSMHDLVMELLKTVQPAELYITTYALREYSVRQLILAIDRKEITAVNMILDYRAPVRTEAVYQMAAMNFNKIFLTSIHAKITVIKAANTIITITGSANWTTNPKIESGVVTTDPIIGEWYIEQIKLMMDGAKLFD